MLDKIHKTAKKVCSMIVTATNGQMLKLAEVGVMFFRLFPGCYKITSGNTAQLREAGMVARLSSSGYQLAK